MSLLVTCCHGTGGSPVRIQFVAAVLMHLLHNAIVYCDLLSGNEIVIA